jgi:hypothetical protein
MNSPFPGMDPYLEAHWLDVHSSLIFLAKSTIQSQLSGGLVARSEERLIVEDNSESPPWRYPDVRVVEHAGVSADTHPAGTTAVAEPLVIEIQREPMPQRFIEIIDAASGGRVVTVIELVSPSNKSAGDGRTQYQRKQQECIEARVNLVEIDLTRAGQRKLLVSSSELPPDRRSTYLAIVYRAQWKRWGRKEAYDISLRRRLPAIGIPLRPADTDVVLDLQPLVDEAYRAGAYDRTINYAQDCDPPLPAEDAAWADELLKAAGKRV